MADDYTMQCSNYALFMRYLLEPVLFMVLLHIIAILTTALLRGIVLGVGDAGEVKAVATSDVEASAIPNVAASEGEGEEPPPYQPSGTETPAPTPAPAPTQKRLSSAQSFVLGTASFTILLVLLVLLALDIQAIIFCSGPKSLSTFPRVIFWGFYALNCAWASTSACCWAMLVRDLWGPGMKKRYPIHEGSLLLAVFVVPGTPLVVLGMGCVKGVEACQRVFCGDALEEEREEMERMVREGVELREREGGDEGEGEGEASGSGDESRDEESVGLMSAVKSEQV